MDYVNLEFKEDIATRPRACKICGEVGHTSKDHQDQCPYCDANHPVDECPTSQVTCFLCEGIDHVPAQCHLYSVVQQVNQQVKNGMHQALKKTSEEEKVATKDKGNVKGEDDGNKKPKRYDHEGTRDMTKVFCHRCRKTGHFTNDCPSRKRARTDVIIA